MVTKKRIRLEERDFDILRHVSRYKLTVLEALERMPFFPENAPHAAKEAIRRLRNGGYLQSATLYRNRRYYHLTRTAVNLLDDNSGKLEVILDDHKCSFGQWLYGTGRRDAENLVPSLVPLLKSIEAPHYDLHASAAEIIKAKNQIGGLNQARNIYMKKSLVALDEVDSVLETIRSEIERQMVTTEMMLEGAAYQRSMITWVATGIVLFGLILSIILSESIRSPIIKAIDAVRKLSEGDVDASLDVKQKDEIGRLALDINRAVEGQKKKAMLASAIAEGNLLQTVTETDLTGLGDDKATLVGFGGNSIRRLEIDVYSSTNITGWGVDNISFDDTAPVPEPATMLLLGTGLLGLVGLGRKKVLRTK